MRMAILVVALASAAGAPAGAPSRDSAGPRGWESVGPSPPTIAAPIAADARTHTIYVSSVGGGVIKSTDGGATFHAASNGLPAGTISGLALSPDDPNRAYVNTQFDGFYRTVDGGAHWTGGAWAGLNLVMDPGNPLVMYGASGPFDYLLKTVDGGKHWYYAADGLGEALVFAIAVDPRDGNVVYAGSAGQGAFKSTDGGKHWKPIAADTNVNAILVDPDDSRVVYVGTDGRGVLKSTDAGRSFARVGSPRVASILSLAKSGQTLYAGTATEGVSESVDGGRTWKNSEVSRGLGNALSVDSAGAVYVGTNFDGAFVRAGGDAHWRPLGRELLARCACQNGDAIAIDPANHEHVLFSTNGGGLLATDDGGRHWHDGGTGGLTSTGPRGIAFDPQDSRFVYTGSVWGGGLYRSEDGGRHWERRQFGATDIVVYGVAVDPVDHSVYATAANNGYGVWKSTDRGRTFTRIDRAPGAPAGVYLNLTARTVTVDPHRHQVVYVPASGTPRGLWRSLDGGQGWKRVDASDHFASVTVDPTDASIVYASTLGDSGHMLFKSIDGGASFVTSDVGLPVGETANTGFLQVNPQRPDVLYIGTEDGGLYKSTNGAVSWFPIHRGMGFATHYDRSITGLAMDPDAPDTLYTATAYHSVYKTRTGGQ